MLRPGVNRNSHGLKVAKLAGLPPLAMSIAEKIVRRADAVNGMSIGDKLIGQGVISGLPKL